MDKRPDESVSGDPSSSRDIAAGKKSCDCPRWKRIFCVTACDDISRTLSAREAAGTRAWFDALRDPLPESDDPPDSTQPTLPVITD